MSLKTLSPFKNSRFSYANQLSRRIIKSGQWRAALRKQAEKYGDGRSYEGFQFSHLLIGGTWLWVIAAFIFAGILHIGAVLAVPSVAEKSGWSRIEKLAPLNEMMILPSGKAGDKGLPRLAPDIRYAFCRYSLDKGPLKVTVPMASDLWTVAVYNKEGDNFYNISGTDVQRGKATFIITNSPEPVIDETTQKETIKPENQFNITEAPKIGLVIVRAPLQGTAHAAFTDNLIKTAQCSSQL